MIPVLLLFALMQQPGFSVEPIHKLCDDGKYYLRVTPGTPPVYEEAPCLVMPTSATFYCGNDGNAHCDSGEHMKGNAGVSCAYDATAKALEKSCGKSKPEHIDVPAIDVCKVSVEGWQVCPMDSCWTGKSVENWIKCSGYKKGCADKTRILQHDEQTPAKYWCHKVQP